jgi:hypothetical protein
MPSKPAQSSRAIVNSTLIRVMLRMANEKRKSVTGDDGTHSFNRYYCSFVQLKLNVSVSISMQIVVDSMRSLGFDAYMVFLHMYLGKLREAGKAEKAMKKVSHFSSHLHTYTNTTVALLIYYSTCNLKGNAATQQGGAASTTGAGVPSKQAGKAGRKRKAAGTTNDAI